VKISKEVKTALLAIGAIILFIYGYTFLKGQNILDSDRTFYAVYDDVQGLSASAPVTINGLQVGTISDISFLNKKGNLLVTMQVTNDFEFSKNSIAKISSTGLLGGKNMVIDIQPGGSLAQSGDTLAGKVQAGLLESMGGQLKPLQKKVENAIVSADSLITGFNQVLTPEAREDLKSTFDNLNKTMASFSKAANSLENLLAENDEKLSRTFTNLDEMTVNFKQLSDSLAQVEINSLVADLEKMIANFNAVSAKINNGEGTLGKLINDDQVYVNLENATKQLEELLQDIKLNPDRYVHISVFGGKADEYEAPEDPEK
jgi:phospholipid/cholesterol/gamma-HCH transport system substrate-binding protein